MPDERSFNPENTLSRRLGFLSEEDTIALGVSICEAVWETVGKDGFHGGLRPDNIIYRGDGVLTLGSVSEPEATLTPEELEYIAPEVFWGGERSPAADIYSLGLILYTARNGGRLPFQPDASVLTPSDRAHAVSRRMKGDPVPEPQGMSKALSEIIMKTVAFEPADRYADFSSLRKALVDCGVDSAEPQITVTPETAFDKQEGDLSDVEKLMLSILADSAANAPVQTADLSDAGGGDETTSPLSDGADDAADETPANGVEAEIEDGLTDTVADIESNMSPPAGQQEPVDSIPDTVNVPNINNISDTDGIPDAENVPDDIDSILETVAESENELLDESVSETVSEIEAALGVTPKPAAVDEHGAITTAAVLDNKSPTADTKPLPDIGNAARRAEPQNKPVTAPQTPAVVKKQEIKPAHRYLPATDKRGRRRVSRKEESRRSRRRAVVIISLCAVIALAIGTVLLAPGFISGLPFISNLPIFNTPPPATDPITVPPTGTDVISPTVSPSESVPPSTDPTESESPESSPPVSPSDAEESPGASSIIPPSITLPPNTTPTPTPSSVPTSSPKPTPTPAATPNPTPTPTLPPEQKIGDYLLVPANVSWQTANQRAKDLGGHLLVITSQEQFNEITSYLSDTTVRYVWLGAYRDDSGNWVTEAGDVLSYFAWGDGEPSYVNVDGTAENYLMLWNPKKSGVDAGWSYNDVGSDPYNLQPNAYRNKMGFIVEFD